jgi:uncharacterized protein (TIGR02246 family)
MKASLSVVTLILAVAGCPAYAEDARSIAERGNQQWLQAYNAGDAEALTRLYSKDAVLLPQGVTEPLVGETSIRKFYEGAVKKRIANTSLPVTEARMISPDTLFDTGAWTADVPDANGGAPTHVSGTYLNVWRHEGSDWRLQADTWNMMPPPQ